MKDCWNSGFGRNLPAAQAPSRPMEDSVFHDIARLATSVAGADYAAITLADADRLWFVATSGFVSAGRMRAGSFCCRTISSGNRHVVEDARNHPDFCNSEFVVGEMGMRFYAGLPLTLRDGSVAGTLCIASKRPSLAVSEDQYRHLAILAEITVDRLDQWDAKCRQERALERAREVSFSIASEASSISAEATRLAATVHAHESAVEAAVQSVRQVVLLDREIHDGLIGIGRPAKSSRDIAGLPAGIETQIDLHATISLGMEDDVDRIVGSAAAVRSRTSSFKQQAQRLADLALILDAQGTDVSESDSVRRPTSRHGSSGGN